jgi:hypothetical protein
MRSSEELALNIGLILLTNLDTPRRTEARGSIQKYAEIRENTQRHAEVTAGGYLKVLRSALLHDLI